MSRMTNLRLRSKKHSSSNYGSDTNSVDFEEYDKTLRNFLEGINGYYTDLNGSSICTGSTVELYKSLDDYREDWTHPQVSIDIPWHGFIDISQFAEEQLEYEIEPISVIGFYGSDHWYAYFV